MLLKSRLSILFGLVLATCLLVVSADFSERVYAAIFDHQSVQHAPLWSTCLLTVMFAAVPLLWFSKLSPIQNLLGMCVYIAVVMLLVFAAAHLFNFWIAPAGVILTILFAYPMWSCARLSSVQTALDQALQNLQDELTRLGMEQVTETSQHVEDPQQARIRKLMLTAKHLRDMHKSRSDTLAFISHDIRVPLGAAMLLLEKFESNKYTERMRHLLERAHTVAEGFLQASRAEMSDVNKYQVLDMVSLQQQVIDDIYEQLNAKKITVETVFPDESVWVRGDFGLLFRALSNVLLNAVNYSPEQSLIKVVIDKDAVQSNIRIFDQGPGIPEDKIQKLFKRFSRADGEHQDQDGSGLGLYFVAVTIRKHRGSVMACNAANRGAEFVITIPLERRKHNIAVANDRRVKAQAAFEDTI